MFEALLPMFTDSFVIVHQSAVQAVSNIRLPDRVKRRVGVLVRYLIQVYSSETETDGQSFLLECIELWASKFATDSAEDRQFAELAVALMARLDLELVANELRHMSGQLAEAPGYFELLLKILTTIRPTHHSKENVLRMFARLPSAEVFRNRQAIKEAALSRADDREATAALVEILTRAGAWAEATTVYEAFHEQIATTVRFQQTRRQSYLELVAVRFEAAIATGDSEAVILLRGEWDRVSAEIESDLQDMQSEVILSQIYRSRLMATDSLREADPSPEALVVAANELDEASARLESTDVSTAYAALAGLLRILSSLVEWRSAVLSAGVDADRFARSAKARYALWKEEYAEVEVVQPLLEASRLIETADAIGDVGTIQQQLSGVPLPIGMFGKDFAYRTRSRVKNEDDSRAPVELAVAFLKFLINGEPVSVVHQLEPKRVHDLELEIRISRWPDDAQQLQLVPVSIEPKSSYDFPTFTIDRPQGEAPFVVVDRGRAALNIAQSLQARPFEFKYAASFLPSAVEQPVAVTGHRTLLVEGFDFASDSISGYRSMDPTILKLRDLVRRSGSVSSADLENALTVFVALANLAGRAVQDAEFDGVWPEARFQDHVRQDLRRNPRIGVDLDEHANAGGGITDLSFKGVPIELKSEARSRVTLAGCETFAEQTAAYAVAKGKRVGILCVLDCSPKTSAPDPAEGGLHLIAKRTRSGPVQILLAIVQGNLARPSRLKPPTGAKA